MLSRVPLFILLFCGASLFAQSNCPQISFQIFTITNQIEITPIDDADNQPLLEYSWTNMDGEAVGTNHNPLITTDLMSYMLHYGGCTETVNLCDGIEILSSTTGGIATLTPYSYPDSQGNPVALSEVDLSEGYVWLDSGDQLVGSPGIPLSSQEYGQFSLVVGACAIEVCVALEDVSSSSELEEYAESYIPNFYWTFDADPVDDVLTYGAQTFPPLDCFNQEYQFCDQIDQRLINHFNNSNIEVITQNQDPVGHVGNYVFPRYSANHYAAGEHTAGILIPANTSACGDDELSICFSEALTVEFIGTPSAYCILFSV